MYKKSSKPCLTLAMIIRLPSRNLINEYFQPKRNIPFERHVFRQASQQPDESMDVFVTRLRTLSKTCVFGEQTDEAIRDQAIDKCVSKELRRRLLREPDNDRHLEAMDNFPRI
jgi:hypothetical protein